MNTLTLEQQARFDAKVHRGENCWTWTAYKDAWGYGIVTIQRRRLRAHRVAYEAAKGAIPPGLEIDHMCHNRACVRPDHLQAVTAKLNRENRSGAQSNSASGVRGVSWSKGMKKWRAAVRHAGTQHIVGYFSDIEDARIAATSKRNELFTNNIQDRLFQTRA